MHFEHAGDFENGHCHTYNHATLVSVGAVRYEVLDGPCGNVVAEKIVTGPNFVFVEKDKYHRLTALQDNTVCACIHALRTIDEDLLDPDFLLEPLFSTNRGEVKNLIKDKTNMDWSPITRN